MKRYPLDYNPILEYWKAIGCGEEIVGVKIRKTYAKIVRDLSDAGSEWYYSPARANHVLEFAENYCHLIQGSSGLIALELWEKAMLAAIFGFVNIEGIRKYTEAVLIIGKKNGKSLLASIVGLYLQLADGEPGPEIYAVATKKDQARKIWLVGKQMLKKSPALRKRAKPQSHEINSDDYNNGFFKPLASDVDTLDGLNVHGVLMDEIHQWKNGKALYDIMADGITARDQPLIFITSTAGTIRDDFYDQKYEEGERLVNGYDDPGGYHDDRTVFFIYEIDKRAEWMDPACWKKANPGLGTIKNLRALEEKVEKAKQRPALVKNLICKEFNIPETSEESWLTFEQLNNTETFRVAELKPRYGIGGVDLSATTDLTAAVVMFQVRGDSKVYALSMFWIPESKVEEKITQEDARYGQWIEQDFVRVCPGNRITYSSVTDWFLEVQNDLDIYIPWVGYDRAFSGDWAEGMRNEFGPESMVPVAQGAMSLSIPMKTLGADLEAKKVNYNNNPVLKWCMTNVSYIEDNNANIKPAKPRFKSTKRIDGFAALLDAYYVWLENNAEYHGMI